MKIVHYGHSCVLLDTGSARLLVDPGCFSSGFENLTDLDAVLITHQHVDHVDTGKLVALLAANPGAALVTDPGTEAAVTALGADSRT
ncbi:MAG: MBL fold metallo-hydrolase, partial [Sciscionella sp.]